MAEQQRDPQDPPGKAKSGVYLIATTVGLLASIAYWYPRIEADKREGWLRIVIWSFFGILIPGLLLFSVVATIKMIKEGRKKK